LIEIQEQKGIKSFIDSTKQEINRKSIIQIQKEADPKVNFIFNSPTYRFLAIMMGLRHHIMGNN